ncbi:MAG: DUF455 family protein [Myxococcota bacterium]|nr:DUF455 family protein [Myxococcota bacterium]
MRDFCLHILEAGDLESKLALPEPGVFDRPPDPENAPRPPMRPKRTGGLEMRGGVEPLPKPHELQTPEARARCLARFAHHELMAVEMFAWAILRWPALPDRIERGLLGVLQDEQRHCRLYLDRLAAHGSKLEDHVLSDYFWKHVAAISDSAAGPAAFFSAMGLTVEQGNHAFAPRYSDAFREAGDTTSAAVCEQIHLDEIEHVRFAAGALRELSESAESSTDIELYERAAPFPLSAARAKGRRFDADARRQAGLSEEFIEYVRSARPPQKARSHPRPAPGRLE